MTMTPLDSASLRRRRRTRAASAAATTVLLLALSAAFAAITPGVATAVGFAAASQAPDARAGESGEITAAEPWLWPVPAPIRVVSPFRAPPTPYAAGHRGIDVEASPGDPVVAPADGVVSFAGSVAGRGVLAIDHGDGVVSAIEPVDALVTAGTQVSAGDPVGTVASGGHCADVCTHFGVRIDGEYVSPYLFLGGLPRAVLLPMG